jgi:hypothetical protein
MQIFQKSVPLTSHTTELLPWIYYSLHDQEKLVTFDMDEKLLKMALNVSSGEK